MQRRRRHETDIMEYNRMCVAEPFAQVHPGGTCAVVLHSTVKCMDSFRPAHTRACGSFIHRPLLMVIEYQHSDDIGTGEARRR